MDVNKYAQLINWLAGGAIGSVIGIVIGAVCTYYKTRATINTRLEEITKLAKIESTLSSATELAILSTQFESIATIQAIESAVTDIKKTSQIAAQVEHKELLGEIESTLSNSKNSSEFEYWRRKSDSDKLEEFGTLILNASKTVEARFIKYRGWVTKYVGNDQTIQSYGLLHNEILSSLAMPEELDKANIIHTLHFQSYSQADDFHQNYIDWSNALLEFQNVLIESIQPFHAFNEDNSELKEDFTKKLESMYEVVTKGKKYTNDLMQSFKILVNAVKNKAI